MPDEIDAFLDAPRASSLPQARVSPQNRPQGTRDAIDDFLDAPSEPQGPISRFILGTPEQRAEAESLAREIGSRFRPVQERLLPRSITQPPETTSPLGLAMRSVSRSLIPLPSPEVSEAAARFTIPQSPAQLGAEALGIAAPAIPAISRVLRPSSRAIPEALEAHRTVEETVSRLASLSPPPRPPQAIFRPSGIYKGQATYKAVQDVGARKVLEDTVKEFPSTFEIQRRGVLSDPQIEAMARDSLESVRRLLPLKPGTVLRPEEFRALQVAETNSATSLVKLADGLDLSKPTDVSKFQEAWRAHKEIQAQVAGVASEMGRGLRLRRVSISPQESAILREAIAERITPEEAARALRELKAMTPLERANVGFALRKLDQPNFSEKAMELFTAMKLTSPVTPIRNVAGNALGLLTLTAKRPIEGAVDFFRATATGTKRQVFLGEGWEGLAGMVRSLPEASRMFLDSLLGRKESLRVMEVSGRRLQGPLGKVTGAIFRLSFAPDLAFRSLLSNFQASALAYRQAAREGLRGIARARRVDELIKNPTKETVDASVAFAREGTFQKELGKFAKKVDELRRSVPWTRTVLLFWRTPVNLAGFAARHGTPLSIFGPRFWTRVTAGGAQASEAMSELFMGSVVSSSLYMAAKQGLITGSGPESKRERDSMMATGWRPNSVRLPDGRYVSYRSVEPASSPISFAANLAEQAARKDLEPGVGQILSAVSKTLEGFLDTPFIMGLQQIMDAARGREGAAERLAAGLASLPLPTLAGTVARKTDEFVREPKGVIQRIQAQIPGVSQALPVKRDVLGEPIRRQTVTPLDLQLGTPPTDPVRRAMRQYGLSVSVTQNVFGRTPEGRVKTLSQEDFGKMREEIGTILRRRLQRVVTQANFGRIPQQSKQEIFDRISEDTNRMVRRKYARLAS